MKILYEESHKKIIPIEIEMAYSDDISENDFINDLSAFAKSNIFKIKLPSGLQKINTAAFKDTQIKKINLPSTLEVIGANAFSSCKSLKEINIPDSITKIGQEAFYGCELLETIKIPASITIIKDRTFARCTALDNVILPDSITEIRENAFESCKNLKTIKLPKNIKVIDDEVFSKCSSLEEFEWPANITTIKSDTFYSCTSLRKIILPKNLNVIEKCAFLYCKSLKEINIPESVTNIGQNAFCGCDSLEKIKLPSKLTNINHGLFHGCKALETIDLPQNLETIEGGAFAGCESLKEIKIPESVTNISHHVFSNCKLLEKIKLPNIEELSINLFKYCISLKEINIPESVTSIRTGAFSNCKSLVKVELPNNLETIEHEAFEDCLSLKEINIPENVKYIDRFAFNNCISLEKIELPDSIEFIDNNAFRGCDNIKILYKGIDIKKILLTPSDGVNNLDVARAMIENNIPITEYNIQKTIYLAHLNKLDKLKNYELLGMSDLKILEKAVSSKKDNTKNTEKLKNEFAKSTKFNHKVPVIVDKMSFLCKIFNAKDIVRNFNIRYTKNIIDNKIPLLPSLILNMYYPVDVCNNIIKKDLIDPIATILYKYNRTKDEKHKIVADYITNHLDTNIDLLLRIIEQYKDLEINLSTTIDDIKQQLFILDNMSELNKILKTYRIDKDSLKCNIPITETEYDNRISRILNFDSTHDLVLAANLGDLTNCCQHLDGAGETAMMHGFINKDAGFWVIKDKNNKVLAQAEIWVDEKGTLVFDNIEFADTDDYKKRLKDLCGDIAEWAKNAPYDNIIMGTGCNELSTKKMEKSYIPKLRYPDYESEIIGESKRSIYTDTDNRCVYLKKERKVSSYLLKNYDYTKSSEIQNIDLNNLTNKEKDFLEKEIQNKSLSSIISDLILKDESLAKKLNNTKYSKVINEIEK